MRNILLVAILLVGVVSGACMTRGEATTAEAEYREKLSSLAKTLQSPAAVYPKTETTKAKLKVQTPSGRPGNYTFSDFKVEYRFKNKRFGSRGPLIPFHNVKVLVTFNCCATVY